MSFMSLTRLVVLVVTAAMVGLTGMFFGMSTGFTEAEMQLSMDQDTVSVGETFTATVGVSSDVPTNVFAGQVGFDPTLLTVEAIDYNISVADLWAEEPWYSNGAGTIGFAGGTTRPGGLVGSETLLTITFKAVKRGAHSLKLRDVRILLHNGLGTDARVPSPIDTIVTAATPQSRVTTLRQQDSRAQVVTEPEFNADLNDDGVVDIKDTSVFMQHLSTQNLRSDFNADGKVTLTDYSIFSQLR